MANESLRRLYENSELLPKPEMAGRKRVIERDLIQIEDETKRLVRRPKSELANCYTAYRFLADRGFNIRDWEYKLKSIDDNLSMSFVQTDAPNDTDVEEFLQQYHERNVIYIIEEGRESTHLEFEDMAENMMHTHWKNSRRRIFEEWEQDADCPLIPIPIPPGSTANVNLRIQRYAEVIEKVNDARLQDKDFAIVETLEKLPKFPEATGPHNRAIEAWQLVNRLTGESEPSGENRQQGRFLRHLGTTVPGANLARRQLIMASKRWLEEQFMQYVNDILLKHALEINIGGEPSPAVKLLAFVNIAFKKNTEWTDSRLEVTNDTPIWAYVYLLIRSGYPKIAQQYVNDNSDLFLSEPRFLRYFEEYMADPEKGLGKSTRDAMVTDYQRMEYGQRTVDPFKLLLYKIMGRCDYNKFAFPDVIATNEDYVWLQISMLRDDQEGEEYDYEGYHLVDLQSLIVAIGSSPFDPNETNPWSYFKILLLTLQFERAISYLHQFEITRQEAVHFAIALGYYGLLRVPEKPMTAGNDLFIIEENGEARFHFARLIYEYVHEFLMKKPKDALQYYYLLTLFSDRDNPQSDEMMNLCHTYIRELILASQDLKELLGIRSPAQSRQPGYIDIHRQLIGITSEKQYNTAILMPVAEKLSNDTRYAEAGYVYDLAEDYDKAVDILMKQLGDLLHRALLQPVTEKDLTTDSVENEERMIRFSNEILEKYENQKHISQATKEHKKYTVNAMLQILRCRRLYEDGKYQQALELIQQNNIVPLHDDLGELQKAANHFEELDDTIRKYVPDVLLIITDILYKIWKGYSESPARSKPASKQAMAVIEEKMRAILAFVGLIQHSMPDDTIIKLNRAEIAMNTTRGTK